MIVSVGVGGRTASEFELSRCCRISVGIQEDGFDFHIPGRENYAAPTRNCYLLLLFPGRFGLWLFLPWESAFKETFDITKGATTFNLFHGDSCCTKSKFNCAWIRWFFVVSLMKK